MSFLNKCNFKIRLTKTSLQTYSKQVTHIFRKYKFLRSKRMSSYLLSYREGSVTVEAAIAIPLFLFAILNFMSIILLFGEYSASLADMHQRAKQLSVHAHVENVGAGSVNDLIMQDKTIKLEPMIPFMGFGASKTIVNCRVRKWTGYDVINKAKTGVEDEWVYITPYGESYHMSRECRYLSLKIQAAFFEEIGSYRNQSGEKYRPCETCGKAGLNGICFYTEHGNRYHTSLSCSGLKRTVRAVKESEAGSRHGCHACCDKER